MRRAWWAVAFVVLAFPTWRAQAQSAIDLHRGPLLSPLRITGLGGAYTAVAEGVEGYLRNPASIANRNASATELVDLGLTLDFQTTAGDSVDFDNDGQSLTDASAGSITAGLRVAIGPFALGGIYGQRTLQARAAGGETSITIQEMIATAGLALFEGSLIAGAGVGIRWLDVEVNRSTLSADSLFADFGVLVRPSHRNFRIGARVRLPSSAGLLRDDDSRVATARYPWEANVGFAYMVPFGDRTWNETIGGWEGWGVQRTFRDNRHVTFSVDLVADGAVANAINPEGYLCGGTTGCASATSGDELSMGLHAGVESEVMHDRLRIRVGGYSEPDRVANKFDGRLHVTGGADLRLFNLWILPLKVGAAFDVAPRYINLQLGLGFWL